VAPGSAPDRLYRVREPALRGAGLANGVARLAAGFFAAEALVGAGLPAAVLRPMTLVPALRVAFPTAFAGAFAFADFLAGPVARASGADAPARGAGRAGLFADAGTGAGAASLAFGKAELRTGPPFSLTGFAPQISSRW
jgi:hypothetical protein